MRPANPYADLSALVDTTRALAPEEVAELHLEQGYVEKALRIYDELLARDPSNDGYMRRRAWLLRLSTVERREIRVTGTPARGPIATRGAEPERTLRGLRAPVATPPDEVATATRGRSETEPPADAGVKRRRIVRVG